MTRRYLILASLVLSTFVLAQAVRADDKVNPAFDAWSRFGVGSSASFDTTTDSQQGRSTAAISIKLIDRADDHVVVETSPMTTVIAGKSITIPAQQKTIPAAFDPAKDEMTEIGSEDVTAAGQTFSCKIYTPAHPRSALKVKIWSSKDVPGGAVKIEISSDQMKISQLLKSFEAK
jgi:hypothetical protein